MSILNRATITAKRATGVLSIVHRAAVRAMSITYIIVCSICLSGSNQYF